MSVNTQVVADEASTEKKDILRVEGLTKYFPIQKGLLSRTVGHVKAVDGVSFTLGYGETLGLVGESGCGKSTTGRLVLKLLEPTEGRVVFDGQDIVALKGRKLKEYRKRLQIIFQDPFSSLDPRMSTGQIVGEGMQIHSIGDRGERQERVAELFELVGLSRRDMVKHPHQFSGGQRQRVGIARALATNPELIVCDEAVSALDVSIQAQILNLLRDLQRELHLSYLFISHDLNVVRYVSDRVAVMYLGQIVEVAETEELFKNPQHPYTQSLLSAIPNLNTTVDRSMRERVVLKGEIPSAANPPSGCRFHTRCPFATEACSTVVPEIQELSPGHFAQACPCYT